MHRNSDMNFIHTVLLRSINYGGKDKYKNIISLKI